MVKQLGETNDPQEIIPGNPGSIAQVAGKMHNYGTVLTEAGNGLKRIDTTEGWSGAAGDAFRQRFQGEPERWLQADTCFSNAAAALDRYVPTLEWAQQQAGTAIQQWNQGDKSGAQSTINNARSQLASAASTANAAVGKARDQAPQKPGFWSKVGHFFEGLGEGVEQIGAAALNVLLSVGNAVIHHPLDDLEMVGGALLASASAVGEALGVGLDVTGVGALVGVPVNVLSAAGVATGGAMMMAAAGDLAGHASGDDQVDITSSDGSSGSSAAKTKQDFADQAAQNGYTKRIPPQKAPFNSHGQPVYTDGKNYITPDVDSRHVSDGWKMFNRRGQRIGTYNWDLTQRIRK